MLLRAGDEAKLEVKDREASSSFLVGGFLQGASGSLWNLQMLQKRYSYRNYNKSCFDVS